ncbi:hypothetical protein GMLC_32220 [Geomonas limicola]|uniref:Thioredoxin domain-containing protein n=2 Tax=Geomonas limicola TaxID=2740186 RepID=A0A6V8NDK8_9BACT|nr:hypothetical protein GMLC_32220 [Geomonas limicola]
MASGGIYDQIGGGFHRYATDDHWSIPHFEKMLYDNALLASTYLEGFWATGNCEFSTTAKEILDYLVRDMKSPCKGFFSATDADSLGAQGKKEEGYFFTWAPEEVVQILGPEKAPSLETYFGITATGNFHGRSVPHRNISLHGAAVQFQISPKELETIIQLGRSELLVARSKRPLPFCDEKMLASWNGLAISAFAKGGFFLCNRNLLKVAQEVAHFISEEMTHNNILSHSFQRGSAKGLGYLDDYSFVIAGFLDLFETTGDVKYLLRAQELTDVVQREFLDTESGGYFLTSIQHEVLLAREKPAYDGAVPSGNSIMIQNLLRLYAIVEQRHYREAAEGALSAFGARINETPTALPEMLIALQSHLRETLQVVIVIPPENPESVEPLLNVYKETYLPNSVLIQAIDGAQHKEALQIIPALKGRHADGSNSVAYVCQGRTCQRPTSDPGELSHLLRRI